MSLGRFVLEENRNPENGKNRGYDVAGFPESRVNLAKQMKTGDRIVFHILGEQLLIAICECTSGYFYDTVPIFQGGIYPHRIRTKVLSKGTADYKRIRTELELTRRGRIPLGGELRGSPRKIAYEDYKILELNLLPVTPAERVSEESTLPPADNHQLPEKSSHKQVIEVIENIGKYLGKSVEREWKVAEYRHDVVWREKPYRTPSVVFEVCDSGSLEKDILSLEWARVNLPAIAILVAKDGDFDHAKRRLPIGSQTIITKGESIKRLHELLQNDPELLRAVFKNV